MESGDILHITTKNAYEIQMEINSIITPMQNELTKKVKGSDGSSVASRPSSNAIGRLGAYKGDVEN